MDKKFIIKKQLELQGYLDKDKTQLERNKLGQFATPPALATDILNHAKTLLPKSEPIHFLDPAFGIGAFYTALLSLFSQTQIASACGYEIDSHYGLPAKRFWVKERLTLKITDFTQAPPPLRNKAKINLLVCNPPYVRHHHLAPAYKLKLQELVRQQRGLTVNGLAGLYCYFLLLAHAWMKHGGLAAWLIPSEFMDVKYGKQIKDYLLNQVNLLQIHRFNPHQTQFADALVSSAVVWFRNELPPPKCEITFSYGGSLIKPEVSRYLSHSILENTEKWTQVLSLQKFSSPHRIDIFNQVNQTIKLGDLFRIKRGVATGANKFFILTLAQVNKYELPENILLPILPSPRHIKAQEIQADRQGIPLLSSRLFLLNCHLPEQEIETIYPKLYHYLQTGRSAKIDQRYLCRHRSPWYAQESRPPAPLLCTYMGRITANRENPFRFILNHSQATAPNVYHMLYPKPQLQILLKTQPNLLHQIWRQLNVLPVDRLLGKGRLYGGGLHKLEPNELANVSLDDLEMAGPRSIIRPVRQLSLFD